MKHGRIARVAVVAGLAAASAGGALCLTTESATANGCPPVFAPVVCMSTGTVYTNQCFADLDGATGCWDIPVDPYPGPGTPEDQ